MGCMNLTEAAMLEIGWNRTLTEHGRFYFHLLLPPVIVTNAVSMHVRPIFSGFRSFIVPKVIYTPHICYKCELVRAYTGVCSSPPPTSSPLHTTSQQTNSKVTDFAQTDCNLQYNPHKRCNQGVFKTYWGVEAIAVRKQWLGGESVYVHPMSSQGCIASLLQITCWGILCLTSTEETLMVRLICSSWCNRVEWSSRKDIIHQMCLVILRVVRI